MKLRHFLITTIAFFILTACTTTEEVTPMTIFVVADGRSQTYAQIDPITVAEFLDVIEIELGELDRINPPEFTQLSDGMRITVRRVEEENYCEERSLPYQRQYIPSESVSPGEERLVQTGQDGVEQVCYRVVIEDGIRGEPQQSGQTTTLVEPVDEIYYVGPATTLDPVDISGTIAYINNGNVWVMRGNSDTRRQITNTGDIDPTRAFSLSENGNQLIVTRKIDGDDAFANQLWYIPDVNATEPQFLELRPDNILYADWVPNQPNTIAYSRAEPRPTSPGWGAYNDLWLIRIDPATGEDINIQPIIEESAGSGGPYGWWGRQYVWSPDGSNVLWIHANGIGLVDLETGELGEPIASYEVFTSRSDWSWRTNASFSPDGERVVLVSHGAPIRDEPPDRSPVFNVAIASLDGTLQSDLVIQSGIWAFPKFSPYVEVDSTFPQSYLAYMQARRPLDSISDSAEYDLFVADRDGSNARKIFPDDELPGIRSRDFDWSPSGDEIVLTYQGNVWIVDVESGIAQQLTLDGNALRPVWSR